MQYHNYEKMGRLPLPDSEQYDPFVDDRPSIFTSQKFVERHVGSNVFLIMGIGKNPRRYYLWDSFVIDSTEPEGENFIAEGPGYILNPPQRLEGADFDEFKEQCARFVTFKDISHLPYMATLRRLADEFHRPNVIDEKTRAFCDEIRELIPDDPDAEYLQAYVNELLGDESSVEVKYDSGDDDDDDGGGGDDGEGPVETEPVDDEQDEIYRVARLIIARQGQPAFRDALIEAYNGKCAVTGCDAIPALEAAHIKPHSGPRSNVVNNGLLLRSDVHTLFDLGLLVIHPETLRVSIDPELRGTAYRELEGIPISVPDKPEDRPDADCLRHRRDIYDDDDDGGEDDESEN
jgi:hypothetical protein